MSELFPEVCTPPAVEHRTDERAREGDAVDSSVVRLRLGDPGQALRGGDWALAKWRQLLGMGGLGSDDRRLALRGVKINLADGRIDLAIEGERIGGLQVHLLPCREGTGESLGTYVAMQGPVPSETVRQVLVYIKERLASASYQTLLKVVRLDPQAQQVAVAPDESHRESVPGGGASAGGGGASGSPGSGPGAGPSSQPQEPHARGPQDEIFERSLVRTVSGEPAWHVFFAELEQQRNFNHYLSGRILVVRHEDLECCFATPSLHDDTVSFFNYSLAHLTRPEEKTSRESDDPAEPAMDPGGGEVMTDLEEADVIGGGAFKVEAILDQVAGLEQKPDLLLVKTSCVPKVIGDDVSGVMSRFEARSGVPTVYLDNIADEENDLFSTLLDRLRLSAEFCTPETAAGRVNLVGFPRTPDMDQLVGLLVELGVTINARVVPEVRLEDIRRYTWAELQVFLDSALYRSTFRQIIGNADIRSLYTAPPGGVQGSRDWVLEVVTALGVQPDPAEALAPLWELTWASYAADWAALTERAAERSLGFVLDRRGAELLREPALSTGVPLLAMLEEMGFALEFLLHEEVDPELVWPGETRGFSSPEELARQLQESRATALYSELYFDRRLSRCGKAQFSLSDFELGVGGAVRTLRRLLQISELPFYRRYGRLVGHPFARREERK